jgi:hypothetical protein
MVDQQELILPYFKRALVIGCSHYEGPLPSRVKGTTHIHAENDAQLMNKVVRESFGISRTKLLTGSVRAGSILEELDDMYREALRCSHEHGQPSFSFIFYSGHALTTSDTYELCALDSQSSLLPLERHALRFA